MFSHSPWILRLKYEVTFSPQLCLATYYYALISIEGLGITAMSNIRLKFFQHFDLNFNYYHQVINSFFLVMYLVIKDIYLMVCLSIHLAWSSLVLSSRFKVVLNFTGFGRNYQLITKITYQFSGYTDRLSVSASFVIICVYVVGFLTNGIRMEVVPFSDLCRLISSEHTFSTVFPSFN